MLRRALLTLGLGLFCLTAHTPGARACGFVETPESCGETPEGLARYMLLRVAVAVKADEAKALADFTAGRSGFRTQDTYVFCVGPDGTMTAHPNPALRGTDVRDLHDSTGNHFIARMLATAKPGTVQSINYLFPRPGSTVETPKTTYYTKAGDQVCGVGVYTDDAPVPAAPPPSREQRMTQLRAQLGAAMPASLRAEWEEYAALVDGQSRDEAAALGRARDALHAAETTLAAAP